MEIPKDKPTLPSLNKGPAHAAQPKKGATPTREPHSSNASKGVSTPVIRAATRLKDLTMDSIIFPFMKAPPKTFHDAVR